MQVYYSAELSEGHNTHLRQSFSTFYVLYFAHNLWFTPWKFRQRKLLIARLTCSTYIFLLAIFSYLHCEATISQLFLSHDFESVVKPRFGISWDETHPNWCIIFIIIEPQSSRGSASKNYPAFSAVWVHNLTNPAVWNISKPRDVYNSIFAHQFSVWKLIATVFRRW